MTISKFVKSLNDKHFLSLAGNGSMAVLSVVTYAMLYRLLSADDMGNWIFFQTAFALLDAFRTGFLQTAFIKFYSGAAPMRQAQVAGSTWYLAIVITLLLIIPNFILLTNPVINDSGILFFVQWYGITLLLTCPFNVIFWVLQADERFDRILVLRIINQGSFILCLIGLHFYGSITIQSIIYYYLGCSLFTSLIPLLLGWSRIATLKKRTTEGVKEIVRFGRFSVGTYLCSSIFKYSDIIIIKFMMGPVPLAIYNLAQRLLEVIEIPIRSFLATAMPAMSIAFNRKENGRVIAIMKKYAGTLTVLLVPIIACMILSADVIVAAIGGQKYAHTEAANVFRIFMLLAIFFPLDRFSGITLDIIHKPQLNLIKIIISLVINILTDIIVIQIFGNIYAVAAGSLATLLFGVLFGYFTLNKYLPFGLKGLLTVGFAESKSRLSSLIRKKQVS